MCLSNHGVIFTQRVRRSECDTAVSVMCVQIFLKNKNILNHQQEIIG